jgi:hypothetical protein
MANFVVIGEVSNPDWVKAYGKFQKVYRKEDGVDAVTAARNMLQGIERKGTVEAIGNVDCITGYAVGIKDQYTGLVGIFQIDSDTHVWENGAHTMTLSVNFDEIMDEKTYRTKKKKASSTSQIQWNEG